MKLMRIERQLPTQPFRLWVLAERQHSEGCAGVHLGVVFALFLTLPYGKFVHGIYRYLALVRYARERRHEIGEPPARPVGLAATTGQGGQRR